MGSSRAARRALRPEPPPIAPMTAEERLARDRKRRAISRVRSDADFLILALRLGDAHPFMTGCKLAGVPATTTEVRKWRSGGGAALAAAWRRWPLSKSLPRLREVHP